MYDFWFVVQNQTLLSEVSQSAVNYTTINGKDIREAGFKEQLAFVQWELENTERKAAAMLRRAKTPEEAAWVFDEYYERSSGAHRQKRINNALALAPKTTQTA